LSEKGYVVDFDLGAGVLYETGVAKDNKTISGSSAAPTAASSGKPTFCTECGTKAEGGKFCMSCGHKFSQVADPSVFV
jgi:hypothetical protein